MTTRVWTVRLESTSYTIALEPGGRWLDLVAWGPHGIEDGPSPLANSGGVPGLTDADAAPVEYSPRGLRPFSGADLIIGPVGGPHESWWAFDGQDEGEGLRLAFRDEVTGLRAVLCYAAVPGTDVLRRWVEITNGGPDVLEIERLGSAGFCVPTGTSGARLTYLTGQWCQEFQRRELVLPAGRLSLDSRFGIPGLTYVPWLAVQDAGVPDGPAWGVSLAWSGSWQIDADIEPSGITRIRAGRLPFPGPLRLEPGGRMSTPEVVLASSVDGIGGLAKAWHDYDRVLAGDRRGPRKVLYNSWEATSWAVNGDRQLELARLAAEVGAELFVVDDGWFTGRDDDTGGLGDWEPAPEKFAGGFGAFVDQVRSLGLDFGLWIEPESVSPKSRLFAEHPDWVYHLEGRPSTLIRNQLLLDVGREDVFEFLRDMLSRMLKDYPISYLKWDINRPATERGRPGWPAADLDAEHVGNYHRLLDHVRTEFPHVTLEACGGGGARTDLATVARADVLWPSDNTAPLDRLTIQEGFLLAHAPHLLSSWVTDAPGMFDPRPRSLKFRFVTAMAGVLGIGADLSTWSAERRLEAAEYVALYKEIRDVIQHGEVDQLAGPREPTCAVQYAWKDTVVVLAWSTGVLDGTPHVAGRPTRVHLRGLDAAASYVDRSGARYSGAHLTHAGLPLAWSAEHDADVVVLGR